MRILFLCRSFNSLTQRVFVELEARDHQLSVEFDVNATVMEEAVRQFEPSLVICPYLTRRVPASIWERVPTLIVHPGIVGDRGPTALDWAITIGAAEWGVTLLQADAELDAGAVWAERRFAMRRAPKSSLYRNEVTEAAVACVLEAVDRFAAGRVEPVPLARHPRAEGERRPRMSQAERAIDWRRDPTSTIETRIHAADGQPGVRTRLAGHEVYAYDARIEARKVGPAGALLARRHEALCVGTVDGALWLGQLRAVPADGGEPTIKLAASAVLADVAAGLPPSPMPLGPTAARTWQDVRYREADGVGWLRFDFPGGGMSTARCRRLLRVLSHVRKRPCRVLVLEGGREFWSNGMDLPLIEAAASPAAASWANITALDDLAAAIVDTTDKLVIAAVRGNAGAGGVFLALAADRVLARRSVVLNAHYKNMGNLFGSELWTYTLPKRLAADEREALAARRTPIGAPAAARLGLVDVLLSADRARAAAEIDAYARDLARDPHLDALIAAKAAARRAHEGERPLAAHRAFELERMHAAFFGFDPSYHVARHRFVHKLPAARTPLHLARHRRKTPAPRSAPAADRQT